MHLVVNDIQLNIKNLIDIDTSEMNSHLPVGGRIVSHHQVYKLISPLGV